MVLGEATIPPDLGKIRVALQKTRFEGLLVVILMMTLLMDASSVCGQTFLGEKGMVAASSGYRTVQDLKADEIVDKMIERNRLRDEHLLSYSAIRAYEIRNPDGQVSTTAIVRVDYRAPGMKTFQKLSEDGSWAIRKLVFDRLLEGEEQTSVGHERRETAATGKNYSFTVVGEADLGANHCYIIEAKPKRMDKYLFEGELWIDAQDFGIVRISGHPATRLSLWINHANFVREYQRLDGFWLPYRDETVVDVKVHGTKIFRIEHQQYVINAANNPVIRHN